MRITTLIENSAHPTDAALEAEHGLSFYIEHNGHVVLSDLGATEAFAENAMLLGVDLALVEAVTISHHHYDHGGGLVRFFAENDYGVVYLRKSDAEGYILQHGSESPRNIGLEEQVLMDNSERIVAVGNHLEILPGVHILTDIPALHPKPSGDQRLKMIRNGQVQPDTFEHEMITVLEGKTGLVVLTGCAHNGVLNMIEAVRQVFPEKPISAVMGGFHLRHEKSRNVRKIGETLAGMDIPAVYTGHCTGEDSLEILEAILGNRVQRLYTGLIISIE